jgi:hypothetical protein
MRKTTKFDSPIVRLKDREGWFRRHYAGSKKSRVQPFDADRCAAVGPDFLVRNGQIENESPRDVVLISHELLLNDLRDVLKTLRVISAQSRYSIVWLLRRLFVMHVLGK